MIISHSADNKHVLFTPEDLKERKLLNNMPAFMRQGLYFFCINKQHVVYNLYTRAKRKIKNIKMTPAVNEMINGEFRLRDLPPEFKFHTQPLKHQLIALRFAYTFGSFLNLCEPGLGKTKVTLDYIWLMQFKKSIIICPKPLRFVWQDEVVKHRPELKLYVVETTDWSLEKEKVAAADIVVVNYNKAVTLEAHLDALKADFIAVDEALIKDPSTDRTKSITRLGEGVPYKCAMSGTLINNSPLDSFAPVRYVEPSLTGQAFGKFRDEYSLVSNRNRFITIGYRNVQEVKDMVASCAIIMTKAEWLKDLPPKKFKKIYVQMGDKQREAYHMLAENYILPLTEVGVEVEVDNPLTVLAKLTQIANGFIYYKENVEQSIDELYGEESRKKTKANRKTYFFEEQPKARALLDLINSDEFNTYGKVESSDRTSASDDSSDSYDEETIGDFSRKSAETNWDANVDTSCDNDAAGNNADTNSSSNESGRFSVSTEGCCFRKDPATADGSNTQSFAQPDESNGGSSGGTDFVRGLGNPANDGYGLPGSDCDSSSASTTQGLPEISQHSGDDGGLHSPTSNLRVEERPGERPTGHSESRQSDRAESSFNGTRAIIWFNLAAELDIISEALNLAGHTFITIKGGDSDIGTRIKTFNTDPSIRFCVCQAKTINYGVTIMGTAEEDLSDDVYATFDPVISDEIFYSLNFSLEVFLQQQDRIHRIGQTRECRYWILLTNSPIERKIADRLEDKLVCNKEILVDIVNGLDLNALMS